MIITQNIQEDVHSPRVSITFKRDRASISLEFGVDLKKKVSTFYISYNPLNRSVRDQLYIDNMPRNLLYRDRDTQVAVLLQTGRPGISQEADDLLFEFPETEDELFEFDAIVAFDPDWLALDEFQVQMLERWVAEKAGGLIVVGGMPAGMEGNPFAVVGEAKEGSHGLLALLSATDGKAVVELTIDSPPVWDGLAAAGGAVFVACVDGSVVAMK